MEIALVNIDLDYPIDFWPSKKQSIGIGYIAAVLQKAGYKVTILEERFLSRQTVLQQLENNRFDIVGFNFVGFELSKNYLKAQTLDKAFNNPLKYAIYLVQQNYPDTIIVVGGYSATFWDEETLYFMSPDIIVRGEGELPMLQIAEAIRKKEKLNIVSGISWLEDGFVRRTPTLFADINLLPRPIRLDHSPIDWIMINSSRGCYGQCTFCSTFSLYGEKKGNWWRGRNTGSVVEEITDLYQKGFSNIQFAEDDFIGTDILRVEQIAREIIRRNLQVNLRFDARVNEIQKSLFLILKEAGLKRIYLGCETGSARDLKLFHKGVTLQQNIDAVNLLRSLRIQVNTGIIMFHPLSTLETLKENLQFIEMVEDEPALVQLASEMFIYKGTPIYRELEIKGILNTPLTTYQIIDPAVRWIHGEFFNYAASIQNQTLQNKNKEFRDGDIDRNKVYQTSGDYLREFKKLLTQAKRRTF